MLRLVSDVELPVKKISKALIGFAALFLHGGYVEAVEERFRRAIGRTIGFVLFGWGVAAGRWEIFADVGQGCRR